MTMTDKPMTVKEELHLYRKLLSQDEERLLNPRIGYNLKNTLIRHCKVWEKKIKKLEMELGNE